MNKKCEETFKKNTKNVSFFLQLKLLPLNVKVSQLSDTRSEWHIRKADKKKECLSIFLSSHKPVCFVQLFSSHCLKIVKKKNEAMT